MNRTTTAASRTANTGPDARTEALIEELSDMEERYFAEDAIGPTDATGPTGPTGPTGHGCLDPSPDRATPWGEADQVEIAPGIMFCETAAQCFYQLYAARNAMVHPVFRAADGFYEEAAAGARVIFSFPEVFRPEEWVVAVRILQCRYPDAYEAVTGETPGRVEAHAGDFRHLGSFVRLPAQPPGPLPRLRRQLRPAGEIIERSRPAAAQMDERESGMCPVVPGQTGKREFSRVRDC